MALGINLFSQGAIYLSEQSGSACWTALVGIAAIAGGVSMMLGFLTPIIGALLFIGGLVAVFFLFSNPLQIYASPLIYEIVLSAAVALLGPGAFSLDARLFGRREIIIPKN